MLLLFQVVQIVSAIILIGLVLVHSPKGDGMASIGGLMNYFPAKKGLKKVSIKLPPHLL